MSHPERWESLHAADGRWVPPQPLPAATMVLRNGGEVLLLRRSTTMSFAPGMHAFPGGRLADVDVLVDDPLRACAIRETAEEVAIDVRDCLLFDRWITPEVEDRRYDVSFFIAEVEQRGRLATTEADSMLWISPSDALDRHLRGSLPMLRPTRAVLEDLAAGRVIDDPGAVVPKLPRARPDGLWDVIDADTDRVLATVDVGPMLLETDGRIMEV